MDDGRFRKLFINITKLYGRHSIFTKLIKDNLAVFVFFQTILFLWEKFYKTKPSVDPKLKGYIKSINNPGYNMTRKKQTRKRKRKTRKIEKEDL